MSLPLVRISGTHSSPYSGAAIVHEELARRLPDLTTDFATLEDDRRPAGASVLRIIGRPRIRTSAVTITTSTPLPLFTRSEAIIPIVFDVRWRWTRGWLDRRYRHVDLWRTVRRATHVFTISDAVADHLRVLRCHPEHRVSVLRLGPGQFQEISPTPPDQRPPVIVLTGLAAHKRNEVAARLLGEAPMIRDTYRIIGVSVSDETKRLLAQRFAGDRLQFEEELSREELAAIYRQARTYVALGVSEGFGFAYVEAAHQGCDVVAVNQPLTREVLGQDATLIDADGVTASGLQRAIEAWDIGRVADLHRRAVALDWGIAADQVAAAVRSSLGSV